MRDIHKTARAILYLFVTVYNCTCVGLCVGEASQVYFAAFVVSVQHEQDALASKHTLRLFIIFIISSSDFNHYIIYTSMITWSTQY